MIVNTTNFSTDVVSGQRLVLDLAGNRVLALNNTGNMLWEALEAGATPDELADVLLENGAPSREVAEADAQAFIDQLLERGIFVQDDQD